MCRTLTLALVPSPYSPLPAVPTVFTGAEIEQTFADLGITHVVWLPDTALGPWEQALASSDRLALVRVCREGEAWTVAAGLHLAGKRPLVVIQNTGLFESGDAMRNVLFDLGLPLWALIGYRSYLVENSPDTAKKFTEPVLNAWGLDYALVDSESAKPRLAEHFPRVRFARQPRHRAVG